jgi:hypothetical protein
MTCESYASKTKLASAVLDQPVHHSRHRAHRQDATVALIEGTTRTRGQTFGLGPGKLLVLAMKLARVRLADLDIDVSPGRMTTFRDIRDGLGSQGFRTMLCRRRVMRRGLQRLCDVPARETRNNAGAGGQVSSKGLHAWSAGG